jgi:hypothetical protein
MRPAPRNSRVPAARIASGMLFLVVVNGFRESNPDVKNSEAGAEPTHKTVGDKCSQSRIRHQKAVVRPFRSPGENYKKHAYDGADQAEHQHRNPMQPKLNACIAVSLWMPRRYCHGCRGSVAPLCGRQLCSQRARRNRLGCVRIRRHRALRKSDSIGGHVLPGRRPSLRE